MWKWAQGAVASVTGAQEPEYGPEAFEPVDATVAGANPYGKLTAKDYEWQQPAQSHVETQTFYFHTAEYYGFAQLIHSNPVNLAYTSQFTFLLRNVKDPEFKVWGSHRLSQAEVADKVNFKADHFSITLTPDLKQYHFTGLCGDDIQVDLYFDVVAEGFKIGKDGVSKYGTDRANPWGTMRHIFWPRCDVTGTIVLRSKNLLVDLPKDESRGLFVMALQGMKPHHAAAKWNFLDFQSPSMSAAVMQFETPNSYGRQQSSIGAVIKDDKLLMTAVNVQIEHPTTELESGDDGNWPVPTSIRFVLEGPRPETKDVSQVPPVKVEIFGDLPHRVDRVDVMAELPAFVKRVASGLSGTNPFIYQYYNELTAKVTIDGKTFEEKGSAFSEATFIS